MVAEKQLSISEWFAQKLELKLKISIDISSRKKKNVIFTLEFQTRELRSATLMSFRGFPRKYKNSLKKRSTGAEFPRALMQIKPAYTEGIPSIGFVPRETIGLNPYNQPTNLTYLRKMFIVQWEDQPHYSTVSRRHVQPLVHV